MLVKNVKMLKILQGMDLYSECVCVCVCACVCVLSATFEDDECTL